MRFPVRRKTGSIKTHINACKRTEKALERHPPTGHIWIPEEEDRREEIFYIALYFSNI